MLEENPKMYRMAGLEFMPMANPIIPAQQAILEASIKQAMSAVNIFMFFFIQYLCVYNFICL